MQPNKLSKKTILYIAAGLALLAVGLTLLLTLHKKAPAKMPEPSSLPTAATETSAPGTAETSEATEATEAAPKKKAGTAKPSVKKPTPVMFTPEGGTFTFDAAGIKNQPYFVAVNRSHCTVTVYGKDENGNYTKPVKAFVCSVGRAGHETPTGRFTTSTRNSWCLMVDSSWGRYAIRIKGKILFHSVCYTGKDKTKLEYEEFNKLGSPASLGCVRLCVRDVKWLYDNCPKGFDTVIYDDAASPGPLGKPRVPKIDISDEIRRGWDPTDWDTKSPWNIPAAEIDPTEPQETGTVGVS